MLPLVETFPPCPVCAYAEVRPLHVIRNRKPIVQVPYLALFGCERCGVAFLYPRPSSEQLVGYYSPEVEGGWTRQGHPDPERWERFMEKKRRSAATALSILPGVLSPGDPERAALDFGCGAGAVLDVLQDAGWVTYGLEPAALRQEAGKRHVMVDEVPMTPQFDLVIAHHVIEHVLNPGETLRAFHRASRPGALLLVSVPSLEEVALSGDVHYAMNSAHINTFTRRSLENLLRLTGWDPVGPAVVEAGRVRAAGRRESAEQAPVPGVLTDAMNALRDFGRRLGADGAFARVQPPQTDGMVARDGIEPPTP